ncbi:phospholipase C type enzyme [Zalaria obscura]|uniref:Phospholipase C type enzyme n=1 Tax=Zalaria obscura TaxID=2024903 RepID=A0ACC3SGF9_9PEZI
MDPKPAHPVPSNLPSSLRILSHNCWGLKFIAKHRHERLTEIGNEIARSDPPPQIVGLQECWTQQDYLAIRERTKHILPYGKFYWSGIFGGGLAILSAWPIEESRMYRYPLNGRPAAFFRGDWFVGKGVACARIRIGPGKKDVVEVFCTHLHAPYEREPNDSYICHRTAQAWEIARLMRHASERGHLVLGLGDFNMTPGSMAHALVEGHGGVRDVWRVLRPESALGAADGVEEAGRGGKMPTAKECLEIHGATCDSRFNTWRWNKGEQKKLDKGEEIEVDGDKPDPKAKRLDYIFFGSDPGSGCSEWSVASANVGMLARHPTLKCSLSDHFSVETTLVRRQTATAAGEGNGTIQKVTTNGYAAKSPHEITLTATPTSLPVQTYDAIIAMIDSYSLRERKQRRLRLYHFGTELLIAIGCLAATWWSPRNFVCFLLMLLSTLGLSAGVIDGLMGGLFVGSELRALKEFEWEIKNAREIAAGAGR